MPRRSRPKRVAVVDGSNLATEGRSEPSLDQLREAVEAFRAEHDFDEVVVIVDASFEHRVPTRQRPAVRRALDEGWMITPPAGVVGRGDTFILEVARRAGAVVVSNDSFQEFHGEHPWLFEEGRLIGGKPVPGVGWVFVPRLPVRGVVSRRAVKAAAKTSAAESDAGAALATPTPTRGGDGAKRTGRDRRAATPARTTKAKDATSPGSGEDTGPDQTEAAGADAPSPKRRRRARRGRSSSTETTAAAPGAEGANPVRAWRRFRREHPEGSTVAATIERFSSHGAYARTDDDLVVYLPLSLLGDPPPRRARDVVSVGERRELVVHRYDEQRHGIDVGIVPFTPATGKTGAARAALASAGADDPARPLSRATSTRRHDVATKKAAKKTATKKTAAKKAPAKKTATKKTAAKKAPTKKTAAKKTATKKTTAKKTAAKKTAAKKTATKKTAAKKTAAKRTIKKATSRRASTRARRSS